MQLAAEEERALAQMAIRVEQRGELSRVKRRSVDELKLAHVRIELLRLLGQERQPMGL
eukprot:CAMPEP_0183367204 /NCGR_PEP_ID=MMETSP0164_2-20130417/91677_1 /TAXON_ID=221442 /ORGANISM="Coccolithus pelagicus ssp braarudi, Strain PLY182g" /LENGTH=57 /DNA_ID=CAMNT_0025543103 /DNA_START=741 /DNA_END=914 /DNA_ORIENTATION=-